MFPSVPWTSFHPCASCEWVLLPSSLQNCYSKGWTWQHRLPSICLFSFRIAQVSGLSVSGPTSSSGDTANLPVRNSSRINSPWKPLYHRRKMDAESEGSNEETDSSENWRSWGWAPFPSWVSAKPTEGTAPPPRASALTVGSVHITSVCVCGCASPRCQVHLSLPTQNSAFFLAPNPRRTSSSAEAASRCRVVLPSAGRHGRPADAGSATARSQPGVLSPALSLTAQQVLEQWKCQCRLLASLLVHSCVQTWPRQ